MKIEQEKIPSAEEFATELDSFRMPRGVSYQKDIGELMDGYLALHKKAIRYEYDQYQFFLDGYRNGSASTSEVREAHDRFLKLLE